MNLLIPDKRQQVDTLLKFHMGYWDYSSSDFYTLQKKLVEELENGYYTDINAIISAYALFFHLSDIEINLLRNITDVEAFFDNILNKITLKSQNDTHDDRLWDWDVKFMSYKGYGIFDREDNIQIKEFVNKVRSLYQESQTTLLKSELENFVTNIIKNQENNNKFCSEFFWKGSDVSKRFSRVPALEWIGSNRLWNILMISSLSDQRSFFYSLSDCYALDTSGCEDRYLIYKSELPVINNLYLLYKEKYNRS